MAEPTPSRRPARLSPGERERLAAELARRYRQGHSLERLSAEIGRSYGFVRRLLLGIGVQLRPRGGDHRSATQP